MRSWSHNASRRPRGLIKDARIRFLADRAKGGTYATMLHPSHRCDKRLQRLQTRSQAVARIADRTAKNCRGHVT